MPHASKILTRSLFEWWYLPKPLAADMIVREHVNFWKIPAQPITQQYPCFQNQTPWTPDDEVSECPLCTQKCVVVFVEPRDFAKRMQLDWTFQIVVACCCGCLWMCLRIRMIQLWMMNNMFALPETLFTFLIQGQNPMQTEEIRKCRTYPRFLGIKQTHHCWACGRVICGSCSANKLFLPSCGKDKRHHMDPMGHEGCSNISYYSIWAYTNMPRGLTVKDLNGDDSECLH